MRRGEFISAGVAIWRHMFLCGVFDDCLCWETE